MKDADKKLTAVIGYPLGHSLSPFLHNVVYQNEGIAATMEAIANPDIAELVQIIRTKPLALVAVTSPYKQTIMEFMDAIDETAKEIGAVNTIINRAGKLYGYNTDVAGVAAALKDVELKNAAVLLLGAGGAAEAVAYYLKMRGARLVCFNRTPEHAKELVKRFGGAVASSAAELKNFSFDVLVNATTVGLAPNPGASPLSKDMFRSGQTVFDVIYNPLQTKFLAEARGAGARTINGLTMFVAQALAQEELWLERKIDNRNYEELLKQFVSERPGLAEG